MIAQALQRKRTQLEMSLEHYLHFWSKDRMLDLKHMLDNKLSIFSNQVKIRTLISCGIRFPIFHAKNDKNMAAPFLPRLCAVRSKGSRLIVRIVIYISMLLAPQNFAQDAKQSIYRCYVVYCRHYIGCYRFCVGCHRSHVGCYGH